MRLGRSNRLLSVVVSEVASVGRSDKLLTCVMRGFDSHPRIAFSPVR